MAVLIDLLPLSLLALLLWRVRPARPLRSAFREDGLSLEATLPLRGALALMVVFHHLAQRTQSGALMRLYTDAGYLPVAMFFFLSGYGVQKKHMASPAYRRGFLRRRLGALLAPLPPALAVYVALHVASQPFTTAWDFYNGVIGEANAWFLVNLVAFYAAFALAMRLCGGRPGLMVGVMAACCLLYTAGCMALGYGDWWYKSSHLFVLGMAWAAWGDRWTPFVRRAFWPLLAACWALCWLIHRNIWPLGWRLPFGALLPSALAAALFTAGVALLLMKVGVGNPALNGLGRLSYDVYILHGILLIALRGAPLFAGHDALYAAAVTGGSIILAAGCRALRRRLAGLKNQIRTREGKI